MIHDFWMDSFNESTKMPGDKTTLKCDKQEKKWILKNKINRND